MTEVRVLPASEVDLEAYAALQRRAFAEVLARTGTDSSFLTAEHFGWKYAPPAGEARIAVVRGADGQLVAVNAMFPLEVVGPNGERRIAWQSCDTATAPEGRGQGNFGRCLRALVADLDEGDWFFGFPNANSMRGFVKLGWADRGVVTTWARPVLPIGRHVAVPESADLGCLADELCDPIRIGEGWEIRRSTQYLRWRYGGDAYRVHLRVASGRPRGLGVLRVVDSVGRRLGIVLELWGEDAAAEAEIVAGLVGAARAEGAQGLVLLDSGRTLRPGLGFVPVPARFLPKRQVLMGGAVRGAAMEGGGFPASWRVQTGDWDGF